MNFTIKNYQQQHFYEKYFQSQILPIYSSVLHNFLETKGKFKN